MLNSTIIIIIGAHTAIFVLSMLFLCFFPPSGKQREMSVLSLSVAYLTIEIQIVVGLLSVIYRSLRK